MRMKRGLKMFAPTSKTAMLATTLSSLLICHSTDVYAASFTLYATTPSNSYGSYPGTLLTVDPSTGTQTLAGPQGDLNNIEALAWDPITHNLFGTLGYYGANEGVIEKIDPSLGVATPVTTVLEGGRPAPVTALAFTPNGTLWDVVGFPGDANPTLGTINLGTGAYTPELTIPTPGQSEPYVRGIAINSNGILYGFSGNDIPAPVYEEMFTFDTATNSLLTDVTINSQFAIGDVTFAPDGYIYATNYSYALLRIDVNAGTVTNVGLGHIGDLGSIAAASSAVPEPSTWAMMLAGFAGLGFAGYRRAKGVLASS